MTDLTLHGWAEHWASERPDADFLVYPYRNIRLSYSQFCARANRAAKALMAIGVSKGDKVGVWATNIPDWPILMFACSKIGAVLVTVNTNFKTAELEYLMENADIHTMCIMNKYRDSDYVAIINEVVPELKTQAKEELKSEKLPMLKNVLYLGYEVHRGMYSNLDLIECSNMVSDEELEARAATVSCHDVVNMQYTSGTTGFPKGVMLTHHNIVNNGLSIGDCLEYTQHDKLLLCVPLFHCFGCVLGVCAIVTHGGAMVIIEEFEPMNVLAAVQKERCTAIYGVPTMFVAELNHPMFDVFDLSSLRTGIMAGAPCPIEYMEQVIEKMNCRAITSVYGLTETSPGMTQTRATDDIRLRCETVGRALPGIEVVVKNPETGEICAPGEMGEMCCRGYNVMKGYYKNEEATKACIDDEGFLHSGDLGVMDENGYFRITGRIKEMIIRGGENIYPQEIENFLRTHPAVGEVYVAGIPSPKYGEQVAAYIKLKSGEKTSAHEIMSWCKGKIARYKVPKYVFFVDGYPMTASGKIQKFLLKDIGLAELEKMEIEVI